jgi:hypothetical protein
MKSKGMSKHLLQKITFTIVFLSAHAAFANPLDSLKAKIDDFNTTLILIGISLTVTAFIFSLVAAKFGKGSVAGSLMVLGLGLAISFSKQIVTFMTSGVF